jgi:hypothetical protein
MYYVSFFNRLTLYRLLDWKFCRLQTKLVSRLDGCKPTFWWIILIGFRVKPSKPQYETNLETNRLIAFTCKIHFVIHLYILHQCFKAFKPSAHLIFARIFLLHESKQSDSRKLRFGPVHYVLKLSMLWKLL